MTRDPVALNLAQPIVNALQLDTVAVARRAAEVMLMVAGTGIVVRLATLDAKALPGLWMSELFHVVLAYMVFRWLRIWAVQGPALLAGTLGPTHLVARILFGATAAVDVYDIVMFIVTGLAGMVPVSVFRTALDLVEMLVTLIGLYACICDRPPPRRRREARTVTA